MRLLPRVLLSIQSAKVSHAQIPDMPLRSDTQALHLIANIPLIQRREKCHSREGKSTFTQWFSSVYARSLKDQARKSKYPRTQILEPRTQSKLICHSSTTFIHTRSNNPIQVSSQSYIGISPKLYSFLLHPIQLYPRIHIPIYEPVLVTKCTYTDSRSDQYWFIFHPPLAFCFQSKTGQPLQGTHSWHSILLYTEQPRVSGAK